MYLEQLILKHNAHRDTTNIKEKRDGIDFAYAQRSHAIKMVDFLKAVVPIQSKQSEQLISTDIHSGTSNYKFTFSVEIAPICKDDLVCLPPKLARSLGNVFPLTVCTRVGSSIQVIDPNTLQTADISSNVYWNAPFLSLAAAAEMSEYYVMDVEPLGPTRGKYVLADIQVAKTSDFGKNDTTFFTRSHLGGVLKPGDTVMGYVIGTSNFNDVNFDSLDRRSLQDVVSRRGNGFICLAEMKVDPANSRYKNRFLCARHIPTGGKRTSRVTGSSTHLRKKKKTWDPRSRSKLKLST